MRHAVDVINSEKNSSSAPAIIAPSTLVAAKLTARSIIDVKIVPNIPTSTKDSGVSIHLHVPQHLTLAETKRFTAKYTTAIPRTTHKNTGVIVMTAVIVSNVVIIPIITLAAMASNEHCAPRLQEQLQLSFDIVFTSNYIICF